MRIVIVNIKLDIYAPSPYTERSFATSLATSKDGKWLAYCINDIVVIRSIVS
jgi:hypothetical protein